MVVWITCFGGCLDDVLVVVSMTCVLVVVTMMCVCVVVLITCVIVCLNNMCQWLSQ